MTPFHWTERRVARFITILSSGAVVVADVALLFVFKRHAGSFPEPWNTAIPVGILGVLVFAVARLVRQIRLFREDR